MKRLLLFLALFLGVSDFAYGAPVSQEAFTTNDSNTILVGPGTSGDNRPLPVQIISAVSLNISGISLNVSGVTLTVTSVAISNVVSSSITNVVSGAYVPGSIADGADVTQGTTADAASVAGGAGTLSAKLRLITSQLNTLNTSPTPTGSYIIGKVGIDQTTPGTTNAVSIVGLNSTTPILTGNGVTGAGSPRVTIASDNSAVSGLGAVATGAAPPANAVYLGANASGATGGHVAGMIACDSHVYKHITSATDTLAVQGVASQSVYICGWRARAAGVATWFLENTASTNANCGSSNTQITGVATEAANTGETLIAPFWTGLKNTSGNGLCINSTGTGGVDVDIWYTQF